MQKQLTLVCTQLPPSLPCPPSLPLHSVCYVKIEWHLTKIDAPTQNSATESKLSLWPCTLSYSFFSAKQSFLPCAVSHRDHLTNPLRQSCCVLVFYSVSQSNVCQFGCDVTVSNSRTCGSARGSCLLLQKEWGRGHFSEPCWHTHVCLILILVVPDQQLVPNSDICCHHKVEVAVVLGHAKVLLHGVARTLDEVHPVTVFRVSGINVV